MIYRHIFNLPYQWPQNILPKGEIDDKYQLIQLGNSHSQDGIKLEQYNIKSLSLASVAQSYEYDLAMLKMYDRQIDQKAIIIIPVTPLSFSQKKPGRSDSFRYVYYDGRISPIYIPGLVLGDYIQSQIFPFVRSVYSWRQKHAEIVKQKAMDEFSANWPKIAEEKIEPQIAPKSITDNQNDNLPKKIIHLSAEEELANARFSSQDRLKQSVTFMLDKWLHSSDFDRKYFQDNIEDLKKLIKYSQKRGFKPILVSIPISKILREALGEDFMNAYMYEPLEKSNISGVEYFDLSNIDKFISNGYLFNNSDHLNEKGAHIISHLLLEKLIEKGYLPPETDGFISNDFARRAN